MRTPEILWLSATLFQQITATPIISSVLPRYGSTQGGTRITVYGSGFSEDKFQMAKNEDRNKGNWVYLQNDQATYECAVNTDSNNDKGIQCWTPNGIGDVGDLKVRVRSDGEDSSNYKTFTPVWWRTPEVYTLEPQVTEPQAVLRQHGRMYTQMYNNSENLNWLDNKHICQNKCAVTRIYHQGQMCDLYDKNSTNADAIHGFELDNRETSNEGYFKCKMGGSYIGNQNFTYMINQDYGRSQTRWSSRRISPKNIIHDLETYAVVESVASSSGGTNGGQVLTISGRWFWEGNTKVEVGGEKCEILTTTDNEITCQVAENFETDSST